MVSRERVLVASPEKIDWLIVGAEGQLSRSMSRVLETHNVSFAKRSRQQLDITDFAALEKLHDEMHPKVIFNGAAWTDVEGAEKYEDDASRVNAVGAANLGRICAEMDATLIHISTDYIFSGAPTGPWAEQSLTSPTSAYGRTKAAGEKAIQEISSLNSYIVRTAWLYSIYGKNFAKTILRKALSDSEEISVVNDQLGQPTFSDDLADQIFQMVARKVPSGIYHGTNSGEATWLEFASEIFRLAGQDVDRVKPISSAAYPSKVARPVNSVLGHDKWHEVGMVPMRNWNLALREAMPALRAQCEME